MVLSTKNKNKCKKSIINMGEEGEEREIRDWIKKKLNEIKKIKVNENIQKDTKIVIGNLARLRVQKIKNRIKILMVSIIIFFAIFLSCFYLFSSEENCSNLRYLYSHLEKCKGKEISIRGIAFTDSINLSDQGNPFYLEKDGYLIDVRGLNNIKTGEVINLSGKIEIDSVIFINTTIFRKEGIMQNYRIEEICEKDGIKIESLDKAKEFGRLFITDLTLLNYFTFLSRSGDFVYKLEWKEVQVQSFMALSSNTTFPINKKYRVCGILLPSYGGILRVFMIR
jgi:hypothetical protein